MLGIPTQSDATAISAEYAQAVELEQIETQFQEFKLVFASHLPNNHVNEAFRDTGYHKYIRAYEHIWDVPSRRIPRKTRRLLKPKMIGDHYLASIHEFRKFLRQHRDRLNRDILLPGVHRLNEGLIMHRHVDIRSDDNGETYRNQLNPYRLLTETLNDFEAFVQYSDSLRRTALRQIAAMAEMANHIQENPMIGQAFLSLGDQGHSITRRMENQVNHPVHALYQQHGRIFRESDITLTFNESYFAYKIGTSSYGGHITASRLLADPVPMNYVGLRTRTDLRDLAYHFLEQTGHVVINGVGYTRELFYGNNGPVRGFRSDGRSYVQIANLLGQPIEQPDGQIIDPEPWAVTESELVSDYREIGHRSTRDELLQAYDFDASSGNPTREKAIQTMKDSVEKLT